MKKLVLLLSVIIYTSQIHSGKTSLHVAVEEEDIHIVRLLLNPDKIHIDINAQDKNGWTPLHLATYIGNIDIVKELLQHPKINIHGENEEKTCTPLHLAVLFDHLEIVKLLLAFHSINVNIKSRAGYTPLDIALNYTDPEIPQHNRKKIIEELQKHGAESTL